MGSVFGCCRRSKEHILGSYVGMHVDLESGLELYEWLAKNNVQHPHPVDKMHTTILSSETPVSNDFVPNPKAKIKVNASAMRFVTFPHNPKTDQCHLVLRFESPELKARHDDALSAGGTQTDRFQWLPHITVTSNWPNNEPIPSLADIPSLILCGEYIEPLNMDWKPTTTKNNYDDCTKTVLYDHQ